MSEVTIRVERRTHYKRIEGGGGFALDENRQMIEVPVRNSDGATWCIRAILNEREIFLSAKKEEPLPVFVFADILLAVAAANEWYEYFGEMILAELTLDDAARDAQIDALNALEVSGQKGEY